MHYHLKALRQKQRLDDCVNKRFKGKDGDGEEIQIVEFELAISESQENRNTIYASAARWLTFAASLFASAGFFFIIGFGIFIWDKVAQ